jgi:hypothetical protein
MDEKLYDTIHRAVEDVLAKHLKQFSNVVLLILYHLVWLPDVGLFLLCALVQQVSLLHLVQRRR